jgi:NADPH-dependent 7-cyano-7-deazaguanine reductase QueF
MASPQEILAMEETLGRQWRHSVDYQEQYLHGGSEWQGDLDNDEDDDSMVAFYFDTETAHDGEEEEPFVYKVSEKDLVPEVAAVCPVTGQRGGMTCPVTGQQSSSLSGGCPVSNAKQELPPSVCPVTGQQPDSSSSDPVSTVQQEQSPSACPVTGQQSESSGGCPFSKSPLCPVTGQPDSTPSD